MHQRHLPMSLSTPHLSSAPVLLRQHPAYRGHFALILSHSQRSMLFFLLSDSAISMRVVQLFVSLQIQLPLWLVFLYTV